MKSQNHIFSIVLGILAATLFFANQAGTQFPVINNDRTSLIALGFLGMALCAQGIGRIAEDKRWTHPISLLGMQRGVVPPTLNYDTPDPDCPINVAVDPQPTAQRTVLKLCHRTTGQAVALIVEAE